LHRHQLSQAQWRLLQPWLPRSGRGGPYKDHQQIINAILWRLHTGAPWRDVPSRYGPWQTIYDRFNKWRQSGLWKKLLLRLQVQLDQRGQIDWSRWNIDSTTVRASRSAAGAKKKPAPRNPKTTPLEDPAGALAPKYTWSPTHWA
jgi:transposase